MVTSSFSRHPTALVGRDRERERLREVLDAAVGGHGSLVLVSGEAGIGKTSLVQDLVHRANERGALVLSGGCYDLTTTPPYRPWVEMTRSYPSDDELLPALPDQLRQGGGMAGIDSQAELFELARDFFADVSEKRPLVLVLEDLHWSDPASLELLRYLGRTLVSSSVLLVATYRQEEIVRGHVLYPLLPHIVRESHATRIQLTRLDRDAVQELIDRAYTLNENDRDRLIDYVWQRAEGNPFFVDELVQGLEAERVLQPAGERWQVGDLEAVHLPPLLLQVLDSRLDTLSVKTHRALQVAAVIGQEVPLDLWQSILEINAAELDRIVTEADEARILEEFGGIGLRFRHALLREALYESLVISRRRALHRQLGELLEAEPVPDPDAIAHHFQRAGDDRAVEWLIQAGERAIRLYAWTSGIERFEAALELIEVSGGDRAQQGWLHYRIGRLRRVSNLEQGIHDLETAEQLATAAGDRVLGAFALFDQGALRLYAGDIRRGLDESLAGDRALEALEADGVEVDGAVLTWVADALPARDLTEDKDKSAWNWGINIRRGTLVMLLAMAGRFHEALALGEPYAERVRMLTEGDGIALASLHSDVHLGLGTTYAHLGRPVQARDAWGQARAVLQRIDHHMLVGVSALRELMVVVLPYQTTRLHERHQLVETAQASMQGARGTTNRESPPLDPAHLVLLMLEGSWDAVHDFLDVGLRSPGFVARWIAMVVAGELARYQGHHDLSWQHAQAMFPEGPETEPGDVDPFPAMRHQRLAVDLALDAGDLETAAAWIGANERWLEWSGAVLGLAELELLRARYHLLDNGTYTSRGHAEGALQHALDPEQPLGLLASHRFLGHLDTLAGQHLEADKHLQTALDLADACAAPFERALTLLELARLRIAQGQPEQAQSLLAAVRAICEPLRAQPTLDQVAALEAEMHDQPAETPFSLTPRELDVLRLVAEGLTDPEVAERLYLSPRTVSSHLTSIYTKLGVSSRVAATRLTVEQGLL